VIREWATSMHRVAAHPLLSWANTAHSHVEVSLLMPMSELGGLSRVAAGRKPFAKEVLSDGPGAAREALLLARRVRAIARRVRTDVSVCCRWEARSRGEATGGGPHWAVCAGLRATWGDSFDLAAVESDWRGLVQPLLRGDAEHARFEATLAQARRLGSSLFAVQFGSHPNRVAQLDAPLLRPLATLRQKRGAAGATSALFGARRRCIAPDQFESRMLALVTGHGGRTAGVLKAVQALRRHLQWRRRGLGRRSPPCLARFLPFGRSAARRRCNPAGNGGLATGGDLHSRPRILRSAFASLLACEARAAACSHPPLWDCFDPQTGAELLLNGLLLGYALPATAGALLPMLTRRTIRMEATDESPAHSGSARAELLCLARRAIGRPLNAVLWAALQPGRPVPSEVLSAADWRVADVWEEGRRRGRPAGSAGCSGHGRRSDANGMYGRQGAQIVLVRSCLFCMDDVRRDDLAASVGEPSPND
jgi:hypothetical protein